MAAIAVASIGGRGGNRFFLHIFPLRIQVKNSPGLMGVIMLMNPVSPPAGLQLLQYHKYSTKNSFRSSISDVNFILLSLKCKLYHYSKIFGHKKKVVSKTTEQCCRFRERRISFIRRIAESLIRKALFQKV